MTAKEGSSIFTYFFMICVFARRINRDQQEACLVFILYFNYFLVYKNEHYLQIYFQIFILNNLLITTNVESRVNGVRTVLPQTFYHAYLCS
jgi:hypothetical protein